MKKITVFIMCVGLFTTLTSIKGCEEHSGQKAKSAGAGRSNNGAATAQAPQNAAPINGNIVVLGGAGLVFGGYVLLRKGKMSKAKI